MTAFVTGTADDHIDLWDKLLAFLQSDATLVSAGEAWDVVWTDPDAATEGIILRGPGLSASDEIYVGLQRVDDDVNDSYTLWCRGFVGTLPESVLFEDQVNPSPKVGIHMDGEPFTYWFVASGRRFMVILKISTVFQALYAGFFLPYATPQSYPYPMFIGGSRGELNVPAQKDWRSVAPGHTMFFSPYHDTNSTGSATTISPSSFMLDPLGQWQPGWSQRGVDPMTLFGGRFGLGPEAFLPDNTNFGFVRDVASSGGRSLGYNTVRSNLQASFGGEFSLTHITLVQNLPEDQTWGVLDGCYRVAAVGNASENIVTYDSKDHLVVQNIYKTDTGDYIAVVLE